MAFHILSGEAYASFFNLQYAFFLAFAITHLFFAQVIQKSFQLSSIPYFFQVFLSFFAFICISLHSSSNSNIDFRDNFALGIAKVIAILIALIRK